MEPGLPAGTHAIVDQAVEEAGQTLFSSADVPLARADELLALLQGPAVRSVLETRVEQVVKHGHTLEGDLDMPTGWLANEAKADLVIALDLINAGPDRRDLPRARKRVARAAAMCLAALDVLDAVIERDGGAL